MKEKGIYYFNQGSKTLHIRGCCKNSKNAPGHGVLCFNTENEVLSRAGLSYKWCEECLRKREKIIGSWVASQDGQHK